MRCKSLTAKTIKVGRQAGGSNSYHFNDFSYNIDANLIYCLLTRLVQIMMTWNKTNCPVSPRQLRITTIKRIWRSNHPLVLNSRFQLTFDSITTLLSTYNLTHTQVFCLKCFRKSWCKHQKLKFTGTLHSAVSSLIIFWNYNLWNRNCGFGRNINKMKSI